MKKGGPGRSFDVERPWEDLPWWTPYEVIEQLMKQRHS